MSDWADYEIFRHKPQWLAEYDFEANAAVITLEHLTPGSKQPVRWKCPVAPDHRWLVSPAVRQGSGCPACAGKMVVPSASLATLGGELLDQWDYEANEGIVTPEDVTPGSHQPVRWKCHIGHSWGPVSPKDRNSKGGTGCPYCDVTPRSKVEIQIAAELQMFFDFDLETQRVTTSNRHWDCDIVIRESDLIVEYDGAPWHTGPDREEVDRRKSLDLKSAGWSVIRIREAPLLPILEGDLCVPATTNANIKSVVDQLLVKIQDSFGIKLPGLKAYLETPRLQRTAESKRFADKLARRDKRKTSRP